MLKDEWLEYFEAVNGRKPRPIDFKEALERGEFVLSEGTEANQVADQGESAALNNSLKKEPQLPEH